MKGCMFRRVISKPCPSVNVIAIAMMARIESGTPNPHSVSIIDSNTPSSAIIEPTDSSMPPVIITSPRPILKIPKAPICRARFCRLIASRKFGLMTETTMQRTISRTKIPSSFFIGDYPFIHRLHRFILRNLWMRLPFGAGSEAHDGLFTELGAIENSRQAAFVHHGDAVADAKHFFHLTTDDDHCHTLRRKIADELVDLSFRTNVDAARRFVKDQNSRLERQPLRQHHFLLIAATEIRGAHLRRRRFDIDGLARLARGACFSLEVDYLRGRITVEVRQ